jgi:hypothetical protein
MLYPQFAIGLSPIIDYLRRYFYNRAVLKLQFQNSFRLKTRFHKALA